MTVAELIGRHAAVIDAARSWRDARGGYLTAFLDSKVTGADVEEARHRYVLAKKQLADAIVAVDELPASTSTNPGRARRVTQLEGEIVLEAISWLHALDQAGGDDVGEHTQKLAGSVRELVETVGDLGAAT